MRLPDLWYAPEWLAPAVGLGVVALGVLLWSYSRTSMPTWLRWVAGLLKATGIALLAVCLLEPMRSDIRPKPSANLFIVLADASQSLQIRDRGEDESRAQMLKRRLTEDADWQQRLDEDFDVRRYTFDRRLVPVDSYADYQAEGAGSALAQALAAISRRYQGRPVAGVLVLTDGNATDVASEAPDWGDLPPVYPVLLGRDDSLDDIQIIRVTASQTNFEAAPVTISAELVTHGYAGQTVTVVLHDAAGKELERKLVREVEDDRPFALRFQVHPEKHGVLSYRVRAFAKSEEDQFEDPEESDEATLVNNDRLVMVDRGSGPYRVLYVTGRPNWELKFLRRAIAEDTEVELIALVRVAKREPKFSFLGRDREHTNPLFRGFGNERDELVEQYDEPVLLRLGTRDKEELRDGFPKNADQLFTYHAIVLDDLEAEFFTEDQKTLIQDFVSSRGGGFLMLGGQECFARGGYQRTPIGELLPVYLDRTPSSLSGRFRLQLTREGWLEPWVRVRSTQEEETKSLASMPKFKTLNRAGSVKPGATILAHATSEDGQKFPALVTQRFGKGRVGALLVGDLWRWQLNQRTQRDDLMALWRQTIRWLVADVPQRVQADARRKLQQANQPVEITVRLRDEMFQPLNNATVELKVTTPKGKEVQLVAEPVAAKSGVYAATFVPRESGAYRARATAFAADGEEVGSDEVGWISEAAAEEFAQLKPNRALLEQIAQTTGGELIDADQLDEFVASLPNRQIPITEIRIRPWWHAWTVFLLAVGLLVSEWGLRRYNGLP